MSRVPSVDRHSDCYCKSIRKSSKRKWRNFEILCENVRKIEVDFWFEIKYNHNAVRTERLREMSEKEPAFPFVCCFYIRSKLPVTCSVGSLMHPGECAGDTCGRIAAKEEADELRRD